MTTDAVEGGRYFAADAEADDELARLKLLEALCDPWTFRHLDGVGVRQGWRCLEVGAGAGSVVRWLSERVGPTGKVVAADLDPRFLGDISAGTSRCAAATSRKMTSSQPHTISFTAGRS